VTAVVPWPGVAVRPAPDGIQAAALPHAGPLAAAQRNVGSDATAVQRSAGPGEVAVRPYAAPDVAPWPADGMTARRDVPWLAAPPDVTWPVVLLAALRLGRVARPFHVPGRVLGRAH